MRKLFRALVMSLAAVAALSAGRAGACDGEGCVGTPAGVNILRVGFTQFAPFSGTSRTGVAEGYSIDLLRMLLEPAGYTLAFVPYDNPGDLLDGLAAGRIDVTTLLALNPARAEVGRFTAPVATFSIDVFVLRDGPAIDTGRALNGRRVAVARGSQPARLMAEIEGPVLVEVDSSNELLWPLIEGDVDAVAAPRETMFFRANRAGVSDRIRPSGLTLSQTEAAFLVHPDRGDVLAHLDAAIASALTQGSVEQLHDSWFSPPPVPFTSRERVAAALAAVAVLGAVGFFIRLHFGVLARARRAQSRAELLHSALDATGASLLIADETMRPIWWNDGYVRNYPRQVPFLERGTTIEELIAMSLQNGTGTTVLDPEEAAEEAGQRVRRLRAGGEVVTTSTTADGRVLRRVSRLLGSGHYAVIATDITSLANAHADLIESTERLKTANVQLENFSRIAAHDLVGPLRNLRDLHAWIREDIEEQGIPVAPETRSNFELVESLLKRQSKLIEDLLEYSRTDQRGRAEVFDPAKRFATIVELCNVPGGFRLDVPETAPSLHADPVAFDIVLRNLISNAVKHHDRETGEIRVTCEEDGGLAVFEVADDGPGIPQEYLDAIFEPFRTLKTRDKGAGAGLGLAFIRRIVRQWGGTVEAISVPGERGARFRFSMPLAAARIGSENVVHLRRA